MIAGFRAATVGRLLILYLLYRQLISAIGLHQTAGHAQTVRPLVAPMAVAAAERQTELDEETSDKVKAYAAATDNVGMFFGEDIFFAIGSIVLIQQTLEAYRHPAVAARAGGLGDPDRDRRLPDPSHPAAAARPLAAAKAAAAMITIQWVFFLVGAMFAA